MNILSKDILPLKTSQKFSSVLEPYAVKVASTVLRRGCHCEVMFLSDILLPLSTDLIDDMFPYRLRIEKRDNLKEDSDILINQIRTLSKIRIKEKIAKLSNEEYDLVIQALCKNFQ